MGCTVSVIVVNFNQGRYLDRAIDSILKQTFHSYHILIVDDGSTDNSLQLIHRLSAKHPTRITFLHHPNLENRGIIKSYQLAISAVKGKYVAFLEADDWWDENYLKTKVEILDRYPQVGVVFSLYWVISNGYYGKDMIFRQIVLRWFTQHSRPYNNLKHLLRRNNVATFSTLVTRKTLLDAISFHCASDTVFFDWWLLIQLGMRTKFYMDPDSFACWRVHRNSTLGRQSMALHRRRLVEFVAFVYAHIWQNWKRLPPDCKRYFLRQQRLLPYFCRYYGSPDLHNFLTFFRRDPLWAVDSLGSYMVNSLKYKHNDGPVTTNYGHYGDGF